MLSANFAEFFTPKTACSFILGAAVGYGIYHHLQGPKYLELPSTISTEAAKAFQTAPSLTGRVTSRNIEQRREEYRKNREKVSSAAKDKYFGETKETKEFGGVSVTVATPRELKGKGEDALIFFHGGFFALGGTESSYHLFGPIANELGCTVYSVDYSLESNPAAPQAPVDCQKAYDAIVQQVKGNVFLMGVDAGGALAISTVSNTTEKKPKSIGLYSPLVDLEAFGDTFKILSDFKPMVSKECLESFVSHYVQDELKTKPLYSPGLHRKDAGPYHYKFPRAFIATGTRDVFQSQSQKLVNSGLVAQCYTLQGGWFGYQDSDSDEAKNCAMILADHFKYAAAY